MEYQVKTLKDVNLDNKVVIVRVDFNVPIKNGNVDDETRIKEALPTIKYLKDHNCKIVLLSHLSRIKSIDDIKSGKKSLKPVFGVLQKLLPGVEMEFVEDNKDKNLPNIIKKMNPGSLILLENTRYNDVNAKNEVVKEESKNNPALGKFWASLGEVYVNDAFGTCHRAHASNAGIASNIKTSCIGFLVEKELTKLSKALTGAHPIVAIFGGAKVSDKLASIKYVANIADKILIGGGMAFTFLKAKGLEIGKSLLESDLVDTAKELINELGNKLVLPVDAVVGEPGNPMDIMSGKNVKNEKFPADKAGYDIGKKSVKLFSKEIKNAKTIIWNGPMGVFENPVFKKSTDKVCKAIAKASQKGAYSIVGGGDSASAANKSGFKEAFSHISTGGGASLEFLSGKDLPGISSIQKLNDTVKETKKEELKVEAKPAVKVAAAKPAAKTTTSKTASKTTTKTASKPTASKTTTKKSK